MKDGFDLYDEDAVKIYLSKNLMPKENYIHIRFSSLFGIFKSLDVFGFEIFK
ncbi:hypothetical protein SDC9_60455 [bioreactor metagenome]|jgi:hypothetical protein|uniref:Uncharacterized protein n=1 Tax=bioreactor metagenome TaxID=1076179 RepID=A0A644XD19_9ZZZZ|nr:hypothetical protein [Sedimentibacter saalensis]MEA5094507.1 hypothetical protein [Sedimentibacter saalensis]